MLTLFRGSDSSDRDAVIQHFAKQVARAVRENLPPTTANMPAAELRGYVRARAAREAREQVRHSPTRVRESQTADPNLVAAIAERAAHLVIREHVTSPIISMPLPHVQTRAA
jgi:hypothetical protein